MNELPNLEPAHQFGCTLTKFVAHLSQSDMQENQCTNSAALSHAISIAPLQRTNLVALSDARRLRDQFRCTYYQLRCESVLTLVVTEVDQGLFVELHCHLF